MFDMGNPKNHLDQIIKGDVHNGISYICTKESMKRWQTLTVKSL